MDSKSSAGKWFLGIGLVSTAIGLVCIAISKSNSTSQGMGRGRLPDQVGETRNAGMTVKQYYDAKMPVRQRVALIQGLVAKGVKDPKMREIALSITSQCEARNDECELRAIYDAVKNRVRYTGDVGPVVLGPGREPESVDYYQGPLRTWQLRGGDCDDASALVAALGALNGFEMQFRVTGNDPRITIEDWGHIYPVAKFPKNSPKKEVPMDTTVPMEFFGREAPYGKKSDFPA